MSLENEIMKIIQKVAQNVEQAVQEVAMDLLQKSKDLVPVDTGDLKATGHVSKVDKTTSIGYATPYALRQHEELSFRHPNGGQAKFLQQPFEQNTQKYINYILDKSKNV